MGGAPFQDLKAEGRLPPVVVQRSPLCTGMIMKYRGLPPAIFPAGRGRGLSPEDLRGLSNPASDANAFLASKLEHNLHPLMLVSGACGFVYFGAASDAQHDFRKISESVHAMDRSAVRSRPRASFGIVSLIIENNLLL